MAILAKILLEEAPRVSELRPEVPKVLDQLVASMLAKQPEARPSDCRELSLRLAALGSLDGAAPSALHTSALGTFEQRIVAVIVAAAPVSDLAHDATMIDPAQAGTLVAARPETPALLTEAASRGATVERLRDGTLIASFAGTGGATEQARRAARCALSLRARLPAVPIVLSTGRAVVSNRVPVGAVIERAVAHVRALAGTPRTFVGIDETTAGLLDVQFDVRTSDDATNTLELHGERELADTSRKLLGRPTPCVGRDRELATLEALFAECVGEPVARVTLVTAPFGVGKTRLRHELLARLSATNPELEVWLGRGDVMRTGSPFGVLAAAIRRAVGFLEGEPIEARRRRLRARVGRHVDERSAQRVAEFIGELASVPFSDEGSEQLRAARRDVVLMSDQIRRAWVELVAAESRAQPLLLVVEDLHYGDPPSIELIDAALRHNAESPFMVVALARPEVHDVFPRIFAEREVQELRLGALTKRAAERLVREALTAAAVPTSEETVARLVDRAQGNAFYLEELIRAVAEGKSESLPDTVLAMLQTRLEALEPEARRVLRAASVFGGACWRSGVRALLGEERATRIDDWLDVLVGRELLV